MSDFSDNDIAIIGMAAHLPGADSVEAYWQLLRDGVSAIRQLSEEELIAAGEDPARIARPDYVPFAAPLEGFADFDPEFFGFSPKEAAIMDPQHRQFLEVGWEALENAGHMPERFDGAIGVYAGCGMGSYLYFNLCSHADLVDDVGMFLLRHTGNDKDFLATRLSHILDLKGPSVNVQTACSTSLVAAHYAAQALLSGECDMAIAGGVTIEIPQERGYLYKPGEVLSPDGQCHAFDHRAQGTVFGSGAGAVVLRRAGDALADGDHIWAIIKGSAINNDGADKAGYLAPSVSGQAAAVAEALAVAQTPADTIDYVECHGTGTYLGDPIEVAALTEAFRHDTAERRYCRIGSVKTNIGHLDTAAGVASLIKAALTLKHREIPPSLGYEAPNPAIDFERSPFVVNDRLTPLVSRKGPARAGVNSLGVGGTNAHAVLEEPPTRPESDESDWPFQLITVAARDQAALEATSARLAEHLAANPELNLADVAWTLKEGRRAFARRRVLVAESPAEAARLLAGGDPRRVFTHDALEVSADIAFMFPGGGAQHVAMGRDLYETEPVFAEWMDRGLDLLAPRLDFDLRALWLPEPGAEEAAEARLRQPSVQLPLTMIVEHALAQLLISWGVTPGALIGHSMGENTAAALAGVMRFEDALDLVHLRGQLMDSAERGGMLSVSLPAAELAPLLGDALDLAVINGPEMTVASGPAEALDTLAARLAERGIEHQRIGIDIAAHSRLLDPVLAPFRACLERIELRPPQIPVVSNRTGDFLTPEQATSPDYWVEQLRHTVRFADGLARLAEAPGRIFLEVGPGVGLSSLARAHPAVEPNRVVNAMRHPEDEIEDDRAFVTALGRLWALGAEFDWGQLWGEARRQRLPLPGYAFQRATYYIAPAEGSTEAPALPMRLPDMADWGFAPRWRKAWADCPIDVREGLEALAPQNWLIFADDTGLAEAAARRLRAAGHSVAMVRTGDAFGRLGEEDFVLAPEQGRAGYDELLRLLTAEGRSPDRIGHFWLVTGRERFRPGASFFHRNLEQGFYSLVFLTQALADEAAGREVHMSVFTTGAAQVQGEPLPYPEKAAIAGPALVAPREIVGLTVARLDLEPDSHGGKAPDESIVDLVLEDMLAQPANATAALRGHTRHEQGFGPAPLAPEAPEIAPGSVWMITGGLGGIGRTIAAELIRRHQARVVLLGRSPLPDRAQWPEATGADAPRIAALEELEALGGEVMVLTADPGNIEQMQAARAAAEARFGPVAGLIHAAGTIDDAPIAAKTVASVEGVFGPKIHALQVIDQVFPDGALDWLVLFSSSSTATAPMGQVDYVAANEVLNAFARARAGARTRVVAIDWGIWADTGMAARALGQEAAADRPERPVEAPLLGAALLDANRDRVFTATLSTDDWVIGEHRLKSGEALMPGTGLLELATEAMAEQGEALPFEIRDLTFLRPLTVEDGTACKARIRLRRSDEGYRLDIRSNLPWQGAEGWVLNAEARLATLRGPAPAPLDLAAIGARLGGPAADGGGAPLASAQEAHLAFGPRWKVLRRWTLGGDGAREGLAELALPPEARADTGFLLHPALLDIATGWAMGLIPGHDGARLWVPVSYGAVRIFAPLPEKVHSWVRLSPSSTPEAGLASFDVTLADGEGNVAVEIEGFSIRRMDGAAPLASTAPSAAEVELLPGAASGQPGGQALSPAEERLRHNLAQGIRAQEGGEAFLRALASGRHEIIVSSMPLGALAAQTEAEARAARQAGSGVRFERPAAAGDFVAPEGPIETALAGFWQELLGVSEVGADDSFFDLGGHSLIAVRLFGKIRKTWNVDFPISVLFEAPTIRQIARLISPQDGETPSASAAEPAPHRPRFRHLVAMHEGEGGPERPFFLVAGMFGNVLNLRHLAQLLGRERPFYGLQARGLLGGEPPHETIEEAARDYIAEMREVQREGPWLVGGFSGGGITAWEITRQLEEAGEEVALCVMLDTPLPRRTPLSGRDRALIQLQELRRQGLTYPFTWAASRLRWELARRRSRTGPAREAAATRFHDAEIEAAFLRAVARYQPQPWRGRLVLMRPPLVGKWRVSGGALVNSERAYVLADNGWGPYAPGLRVHEVPGDHDSMVLEPNVRVLAQRLQGEIEEAERGSTRRSAPRDVAAPGEPPAPHRHAAQ